MRVRFKITELTRLYSTPLIDLKGKQKYSYEVIAQFKKKVIIMLTIKTVSELKEHRGLNFERLKGSLSDFFSIRLNKQYRLLFRVVEESENEIVVEEIIITEISKHYE